MIVFAVEVISFWVMVFFKLFVPTQSMMFAGASGQEP